MAKNNAARNRRKKKKQLAQKQRRMAQAKKQQQQQRQKQQQTQQTSSEAEPQPVSQVHALEAKSSAGSNQQTAQESKIADVADVVATTDEGSASSMFTPSPREPTATPFTLQTELLAASTDSHAAPSEAVALADDHVGSVSPDDAAVREPGAAGSAPSSDESGIQQPPARVSDVSPFALADEVLSLSKTGSPRGAQPVSNSDQPASRSAANAALDAASHAQPAVAPATASSPAPASVFEALAKAKDVDSAAKVQTNLIWNFVPEDGTSRDKTASSRSSTVLGSVDSNSSRSTGSGSGQAAGPASTDASTSAQSPLDKLRTELVRARQQVRCARASMMSLSSLIDLFLLFVSL